MEIVEAILAFFKKNNTAVINIIFPFIAIVLIFRDFSKELMLVVVPILISFVVTRLFSDRDKKEAQSIRNRDKEEAQFFRNKDKEDNDARNLRTELREYFLINCKPIIDEIIEDSNQKYEKYVSLKDKEVETLEEIFKNHLVLIYKLSQKFTPLQSFVQKDSYREYAHRFDNYSYIIKYIIILYTYLIHPQMENLHSQSLNMKQKKLFSQISNLITIIDLIFLESELILFNYKFDDDGSIFDKQTCFLDEAILETGLDNAEDFLFDKEKIDRILKSLENKTTETK